MPINNGEALLATLPYDASRRLSVPERLSIRPLSDAKRALTMLCDEIDLICQPSAEDGSRGGFKPNMQFVFERFLRKVSPDSDFPDVADDLGVTQSVSYDTDDVNQLEVRRISIPEHLVERESDFDQLDPIQRLRAIVEAGQRSQTAARTSATESASERARIFLVLQRWRRQHDIWFFSKARRLEARYRLRRQQEREKSLCRLFAPHPVRTQDARGNAGDWEAAQSEAERKRLESIAQSRWNEAEREKLAEVIAQTTFGLHTSYLLSRTRIAVSCFNTSFTRLYHCGTFIAIEVGHSVVGAGGETVGEELNMALEYSLPVILEQTNAFKCLANSFFLRSATPPAQPDEMARSRFLFTILFSVYHALHSPDVYDMPSTVQEGISKMNSAVDDESLQGSLAEETHMSVARAKVNASKGPDDEMPASRPLRAATTEDSMGEASREHPVNSMTKGWEYQRGHRSVSADIDSMDTSDDDDSWGYDSAGEFDPANHIDNTKW